MTVEVHDFVPLKRFECHKKGTNSEQKGKFPVRCMILFRNYGLKCMILFRNYGLKCIILFRFMPCQVHRFVPMRQLSNRVLGI